VVIGSLWTYDFAFRMTTQENEAIKHITAGVATSQQGANEETQRRSLEGEAARRMGDTLISFPT
jgi:hypothetical protein